MTDYLPNNEVVSTQISPYYAMLLNFLMGAGVAVTTIGIILAGIRFLISRGDAKATDRAKLALTYSVVGMVLAVGAFSVKALVLNSLGDGGSAISGEVPGF